MKHKLVQNSLVEETRAPPLSVAFHGLLFELLPTASEPYKDAPRGSSSRTSRGISGTRLPPFRLRTHCKVLCDDLAVSRLRLRDTLVAGQTRKGRDLRRRILAAQ